MRDLATYINQRLHDPENRFGLIAGLICLIVVPIILSVVLILGEYSLQSKANEFEGFKKGVCTLLNGSNVSVPQTKALLQSQADRARLRYKADIKLGLYQQAQSDLDAAHLYQKLADTQKTIDVTKFNCTPAPASPQP